MLKSSIKQMTMSVVCIVMCLIVTTALANDLPFSDESYFTSAHNAGNTVEKRYTRGICNNPPENAGPRAGCTFLVLENDRCTQLAGCRRLSGDRWNDEDLCKSAKWAVSKAFTKRFDYQAISRSSSRVNSDVHIIDDDLTPSWSASFYNNTIEYAFLATDRFLHYQNLTIESFFVNVTIYNCDRFML